MNKDISDLILEYFSDKLQLDESPAGAIKRDKLQKKIIKLAKERQVMLRNPSIMDEIEDQAYPDLYLDDEWFDHRDLFKYETGKK